VAGSLGVILEHRQHSCLWYDHFIIQKTMIRARGLKNDVRRDITVVC